MVEEYPWDAYARVLWNLGKTCLIRSLQILEKQILKHRINLEKNLCLTNRNF